MDKPNFAEAKRIARNASKLDKQYGELCSAQSAYAEKVKADSRRLTAKSTEEILKNMSVDELSRAKQGIRVQALKDAGYENVYQLTKKNAGKLQNVNGVGPKSAAATMKLVEQIVDSVESNATVKIDADDKYGNSDKLVKSLYQAKAAGKISNEAREVYSETHEDITRLMKESKPARSRLAWFFSTRAQRKKALDSMDELNRITGEQYTEQAKALQEEKSNINRVKREDYWKDYAGNAAGYYATLENIRSGASVDDSELNKSQKIAINNGMSEELAVAVGEVELNLEGLNCELRPYQVYGVQYILNQGAVLLGDEMGLGKTVEAIASMVALRNIGGTHFFVVCPASVIVNWVREIEKFSDIPAIKIHGRTAEAEFDRWIADGGVGVTTYETLAKIYLPKDFTYSMLVTDEAHYVKNPEAERTINLLYFRKHTDRVLFMTGTPIENNVEEMCFLLSNLQPDVARSVYGSTSIAQAKDFRRKIASAYFRRSREDVLDELPEKVEFEEWCSMSSAEELLYAKYAVINDFNGMRQVSFKIDKPEDSGKVIRLKELVEEYLANGRKIIIFSFYINTIDQIRKIYGDQNCLYGPITGAINPGERQNIIDKFTAHEGGAILLSQIQAGGTGLNIQAASVIIFCEPQLKPSIENQAIARSYRMGQINTVMVHRLLCDDSVDERIRELLKTKQDIFDQFADISESGQESLTNKNAIKEILEQEKARLALKES